MYPTPDAQAGDDRRMDTYTHTHINWEAGLAVCKKKKENKKSSDDTTVLY